jgi:phosphate starvation-inducible membrane PsiE
MAFLGMLEKGHITVDDILLLFIYLELGAMVGIYFKTNHTILTLEIESKISQNGLLAA